MILLLSWQREPLNLCAAVVMEALGTAGEWGEWGGGGGGVSVDVEGLWEAGLLVLPSHLDPKTPVRERGRLVRPKDVHLEFSPCFT